VDLQAPFQRHVHLETTALPAIFGLSGSRRGDGAMVQSETLRADSVHFREAAERASLPSPAEPGARATDSQTPRPPEVELRWRFTVLAPLALSSAPALAAPGLSAATLRDTLATFNAHAAYPLPPLSPSELKALADGEVFKTIDRPGGDERRRAIGMLVVPTRQADLWVACQDPHFTATEELTELRLSRDPSTGRASWYGHADLPSPFHDRHWVVDVWNNHALAAATDGAMWEHPWRLDLGGVARVRGRVSAGEVGQVEVSAFDESIETPVNEGAWIAIDLPGDRALVAYHATTVVGGSIPDGLMSRFVLLGMDKMLRGVARRAIEVVPTHYVGGHEPIPAGGPGLTPTHGAR